MAAMQTTMIRASMTAYSTAVGPSSAFRKLTRAFLSFCISVPRVEEATLTIPAGRPAARVSLSRPRGSGWPGLAWPPAASGARGGVQRDVAEGVGGVGAQGADGGDADHDDQGQHDRVLDRRRAVLGPQEAFDLGEPLHEHFPLCCAPRPWRPGEVGPSSPRGVERWIGRPGRGWMIPGGVR